MSTSYSIYEVTHFPKLSISGVIARPQQQILSDDDFDQPPTTEFVFERTIDQLEAEVFSCVHEFSVNRPGRYMKTVFPYYIGKQNFTSYLLRTEHVLIVKANKDIAVDAMNKLSENPYVKVFARRIDLESIRSLLTHGLRAGYITVDNNPDIKSLAFFGPSIDSDIRYELALEEGKIYYARLVHSFENNFYHIGLTETCNMTLYDSYLDEHSELRLVMDIKNMLLDKAQFKS